jgi:hypothetical protein
MGRLVAAFAAALLIGLLLGRATSPPHSGPPSAVEPTAPGPTSKKAGVAVGFSRTREGAILAVASYQQAFADERVLEPGELRRRIRVAATAEFAPVMLEANTPGAERLRAGAFGEGIRGGVPSAYFGVPVAYRILSYGPKRAVVQTWGFTLLGNVSSVEPTAYFGLSRTVLTWRERDWKIEDTRASFGPTPRLASPRPGGEGLGLVELTKEMHRYGVAP